MINQMALSDGNNMYLLERQIDMGLLRQCRHNRLYGIPTGYHEMGHDQLMVRSCPWR